MSPVEGCWHHIEHTGLSPRDGWSISVPSTSEPRIPQGELHERVKARFREQSASPYPCTASRAAACRQVRPRCSCSPAAAPTTTSAASTDAPSRQRTHPPTRPHRPTRRHRPTRTPRPRATRRRTCRGRRSVQTVCRQPDRARPDGPDRTGRRRTRPTPRSTRRSPPPTRRPSTRSPPSRRTPQPLARRSRSRCLARRLSSSYSDAIAWAGEICDVAESLDVIADDYHFDGIPEELAAGYYIVNFSNEGNEAHEIFAVPDQRRRHRCRSTNCSPCPRRK